MSFLKKLLSAIFPSKPATVVTTAVGSAAQGFAGAVKAAAVAPVEPVVEAAPVEDVVEAAIKKPAAKKAAAKKAADKKPADKKAPKKPNLNVAK